MGNADIIMAADKDKIIEVQDEYDELGFLRSDFVHIAVLKL